jgi:hypothetical protein
MEVEKSALALTAWVERIGRRILPVAIGGCWGWRGRIGKVENSNGLRVDEVGPIPDLRHCAGREIYVLLDATRSAIQKCSRRGRRSFGNWSTGAAESSAVALNLPALGLLLQMPHSDSGMFCCKWRLPESVEHCIACPRCLCGSRPLSSRGSATRLDFVVQDSGRLG